MADFKLEGLKVNAAKTVPYVMEELVGINGMERPTLHTRPGGEANKVWWSEYLRRSSKEQKALTAGKTTAESVASNRALELELCAKHCVVSWDDIRDGDKAPVKFTPAEALEFFRQMPIDIVDRYRNFVGDPANFRDVMPIDEEAVAKN